MPRHGVAPDTVKADEAGEIAEAAGDLHRVLTRLCEVDVARAFASPESLTDCLTVVRKKKARCPETVSKGAAAA